MSRPDLATALGVNLSTLKNWEGAKSFPDAPQLAHCHKIGFDVMYILTGQRDVRNQTREETASYELAPAKQLAVKLATLNLSQTDTELIWTMARRLCQK